MVLSKLLHLTHFSPTGNIPSSSVRSTTSKFPFLHKDAAIRIAEYSEPPIPGFPISTFLQSTDCIFLFGRKKAIFIFYSLIFALIKSIEFFRN